MNKRILCIAACVLLTAPGQLRAQEVKEEEYLHPFMISPKDGVERDAFYIHALGLAEEYRDHVVDVQGFLKILEEKKAVILDVRSEKLFRFSHINGAVHLPFRKLKEKVLAEIVPSKETYILICSTDSMADFPLQERGEDYFALPVLYTLGYKNSYQLQSGMKSARDNTFRDLPVVYPEE